MSYKIKDIDKSLRPRELAIKNGINSLSNEDLLAIILGSGTKDINVKELSLTILNSVGTLDKFLDLTIQDLVKIKGIGNTKSLNILASIEFGKRILNYHKDKIKIVNPKTVFDLYKYDMKILNQEVFIALYLDNNKCLIEDEVLFKGTINACIANPREIFKYALKLSASSIVLVHNHPSNNVNPSKEDITLTNNLVSIGKMLSIPIIDHIIIGKTKYYSIIGNQLYEEKK